MRSLEGKVWGVQSPSQVDWYMCNWLINVVGNNDVNTYIEVHSIGTNVSSCLVRFMVITVSNIFSYKQIILKVTDFQPFNKQIQSVFIVKIIGN